MVQVSSGAWILISGALLGGVIIALPRIKAEVEDSPLGPKDKDAVVSDWSDWGKCKWKGKKGILKVGGYKKCRTRTQLWGAAVMCCDGPSNALLVANGTGESHAFR